MTVKFLTIIGLESAKTRSVNFTDQKSEERKEQSKKECPGKTRGIPFSNPAEEEQKEKQAPPPPPPQAGETRRGAYDPPGQRPAVIIEVSDDGPGIAPDDRQRVFERFNRGSAITAGGTGGTGIGLSIVRWAAALHDGTVEVVDAPDGGATIRLTFPT